MMHRFVAAWQALVGALTVGVDDSTVGRVRCHEALQRISVGAAGHHGRPDAACGAAFEADRPARPRSPESTFSGTSPL